MHFKGCPPKVIYHPKPKSQARAHDAGGTSAPLSTADPPKDLNSHLGHSARIALSATSAAPSGCGVTGR